MGDVLAQAEHLLLGVLACGDVDAGAPAEQWPALCVVLDPAEGSDPAQVAIGQDEAELLW